MEGYAYGSQVANMAGELGSVVKMGLYRYYGTSSARSAFPLIVPPMSLKKYATGKGNAKKQEMLLAVYKKWGVEFTDDNMADSYVLAHIARQQDATAGLLAYELDVLKKMRDPKHREHTV
jgi:crossover junction endodeoxyribonuclease RuvC